MKSNKMYLFIVPIISITFLTGIGFDDIKKKTGNKLDAKTTVLAVGVAAKFIYDMVIKHKSKELSNEEKVIADYKKAHKKLPKTATLVSYETNIKPNEVIKAGKKISIVSVLEVVRGATDKKIKIEERLTIFDNKDSSKELKSLTKRVNKKTKASGRFENTFTFSLPKGMPQGIYAVKTTIIVDGKEFETSDNKIQLVLEQSNGYLVAAN